MSEDEKRRPIIGFVVNLIGSIYALIAVFFFSLITVGVSIFQLIFTGDATLLFTWISLIVPIILYIITLIAGFIAIFKIKAAKIVTLVSSIIAIALIAFALYSIWANPSIFGELVLTFAMHPIIAGLIVLVGGILLVISV